MAGGWLVVAEPSRASALGAAVAGMGDSVTSEGNPWRARELLAGGLVGSGVVVAEGVAGPDAVNVAAALVADGNAAEVVLAVGHASGSLRSRAKRAGISRVVEFGELAARGGVAGAKGGLGASSLAPAAEGPRRHAGASVATDCTDANGVADVAASLGERDVGCQRKCAGADPGIRHREGVPVLCLVSGRGGVGKTSVCALWGHLASGWGLRVAALDLDLAFGNLHAVCGADRPGDLSLLAGEGGCAAGAIDSLGVAASERLTVWGPCASPERAELVQPLAERIACHLTQAHDLVLIDTTTNWGDAVAAAAQMADRLVVVSDGRPGGMPALARCGSLAVRLGVARTRIVRLVNGCDARGRDEARLMRAAQGFEFAREIRVLDGGGEATELLASGHAPELAASGDGFAESLATGLAQLLKELGKLPDNEGALKALEGKRRQRGFLGRRREVT